MRRLLLAVALFACGDDGGGDGGPLTDGNVTVAPVELPYAIGQTTAVDYTPDGKLVAISDGQLVEVPAAGGAFTVINADPVHVWMSVGPDGTIYTVTATELRTYAAGATTPTIVPIDPAGPLATNRRVEGARFSFSPTGTALVALTNNNPAMYAYRSDDRGATWVPQPVFTAGGNVLQNGGDITYAANGDLIMSTFQSFSRSVDGGTTWTTITPGPRAGYGGRLVPLANGDVLHYPPGGGGLLISRDAGQSWTELTPFNTAPLWTEVIERADGSLLGIANRRGAGNGFPIRAPMSLYESTDGGVTWSERITANSHDVAATGDRIALGLGWPVEDLGGPYGGVYETFDRGTEWIPSGFERISGERIGDFTFDTDGQLVLMANQGLYRRTAAGWRALAYDHLGLGKIAVLGDGTILIVRPGTFFQSADDGQTWTQRDVAVNLGDRLGPASVVELRTNDELLVSWLNMGIPPAGILVRSNRTSDVEVPMPATVTHLVQMRGGTVYATVDDAVTRQFQSFDGAMSFLETAEVNRVHDYNGADRGLVWTNGADGLMHYGLVNVAGEVQNLTLAGLPHAEYLVRKERFAPDDTLYLGSGSGLFQSTAPVR